MTGGRPGTLPVGAKLCWAVAVAGQGVAVRVESTDPRRFARELEWEWDLAGNNTTGREARGDIDMMDIDTEFWGG